MALCILKQKSKLSYDDFVEDFKTRESVIADMQLTKVPCASTLKMFVLRIDTINLTNNKNLETIIESTGFQFGRWKLFL